MYIVCLLRYKYQLVQVQRRLKTGFGKKARFHKKKEYTAFSELSRICDCIVKKQPTVC